MRLRIFSVNLKINEISNDIIKEKYYFKVQGNEIDKEIIFEPKIINKITNFETDLYNLPKYKYIPYHGKFTEENTFFHKIEPPNFFLKKGG